MKTFRRVNPPRIQKSWQRSGPPSRLNRKKSLQPRSTSQLGFTFNVSRSSRGALSVQRVSPSCFPDLRILAQALVDFEREATGMGVAVNSAGTHQRIGARLQRRVRRARSRARLRDVINGGLAAGSRKALAPGKGVTLRLVRRTPTFQLEHTQSSLDKETRQ